MEKRIEALPPEEKTRQRQQLAQPVLNDLKAWLEKNRPRVPRDSLTYKAIQYTLSQWELLIGYLADGRLNISNALAENAIRPFAVGRRNWLFADTPRGAKASARPVQLKRSRPCYLGTSPSVSCKRADSLALTEELTLADGRDSRITGMTGLELDGHVQGVGQGFEGGHPQVAPCLGLGQADFTDPRPRR
ncbi:IS66 family transposase [Thiolapillus sp.]|uniref:IS66 family transposase n=1 Tax=Thiolapillus sp. TaxID=2017437 RepID=UPI003AF4CF29